MKIKKGKYQKARKQGSRQIILVSVILLFCFALLSAGVWIYVHKAVLSQNSMAEEDKISDAERQQKETNNSILLDKANPQEQPSSDEENIPNEVNDDKEEILHFIDAWGEWHDAVIDPALRRHPYNWNCLKRNGIDVGYEGDSAYSVRKGIDVSHHQGPIDWNKVKADGYDFAFIRIGYRGYGKSGTLEADREFAANLANAQAAGLDVGVYFFAQAINETEAMEEAEFVIKRLSGANLQLPVVYDPELIRDDTARTDDVTGEQFTKNTVIFCEAIRRAGFEPMVYSNMIWEGFLFDMKQLENYPVWYADYEPIPQTPYDFVFWQYTEKGTVDGVDGIVDLDVQFVKNED